MQNTQLKTTQLTGYAVYGEARNRKGAQWPIDQGLRWVDTPREVARAADVGMTSLPNEEVVESVATGADGVLAGLSEGKIWADRAVVGISDRAYPGRPPRPGPSVAGGQLSDGQGGAAH